MPEVFASASNNSAIAALKRRPASIVRSVPIIGIRRKPAKSEPAIAPIVLKEEILPILRPRIVTLLEYTWLATGKVAPMHNVANTIKAADRTNWIVSIAGKE